MKNEIVSVSAAKLDQMLLSVENGLNIIETLTAGVPRSRSVHAAMSQLHFVIAELTPRADSSNVPVSNAAKKSVKKSPTKAVTLYKVRSVDVLPKGYADIHTLVKTFKISQGRMYKMLRNCKNIVRFENRVHAPVSAIKAAL